MAILNECHVFEIERQGQWMQVELADAQRVDVERSIGLGFEILPHRLIRDRCGEYHRHHQNERDTVDPGDPA